MNINLFWTGPNFLNDALRTIFTLLDNLGYFLLSAVYDIFFTVANANIFQGTLINAFYSRVQLILGVFMVFMLSVTFLQMIVNPDLARDKQKGAGSLVKRIAISLVLLTLIVPIELDEETIGTNPLNEQIANNGILFGFLYQIQNTVIEDNVLGKLVLGSNVDSTSGQADSNGTELSGMAGVGSQMAATVAKAFIRPALGDIDEDSVTDNDTYETNVACQDQAAPYFNSRVTAGSLLNHVNDTCDYNGDEIYVFDYAILGGLFCSIIMTIIILGFTIDVAVRAVKLAILRLIAPIPIISYISPGQEKDGAFNNWVKTLTSTYISLFVRLIIIYFGIYLIVILTDLNDDFSILQSNTNIFTSFFATIFIIIGILMFMKEAPKFFQDMLGLKGDGKLFGGIGSILGAAALTAGLVGAARGSYRIGMDEARELNLSEDEARKRARRSAIGGVLGGGYAGAKAFMTSDKNVPSAVFAAMQKRQAVRGSGVTLGRRVSSVTSGLLSGSSLGGRSAAQAELYGNAASAIKAYGDMLEEQALKDRSIVGTFDGVIGFDSEGNEVALTGNYRDIENRIAQARAEGKKDFELANGNRYSLQDVGYNELEKLKESQITNWAASAKAKTDPKVQGKLEEAVYAANRAGVEFKPYVYTSDDENDNTTVKRAIGEAMNAERRIKTNPELQWDIAADKQVNNNGK